MSSAGGEVVISYRTPTRRQGEVTGLVAAAVLCQLTVLFLDLEGCTRFSAGRSAQEVAGYLNEIFAHIAPVIEACGGTIDNYAGDGLIAFWRAPRPDSEHAANALECALELADRLGS